MLSGVPHNVMIHSEAERYLAGRIRLQEMVVQAPAWAQVSEKDVARITEDTGVNRNFFRIDSQTVDTGALVGRLAVWALVSIVAIALGLAITKPGRGSHANPPARDPR